MKDAPPERESRWAIAELVAGMFALVFVRDDAWQPERSDLDKIRDHLKSVLRGFGAPASADGCGIIEVVHVASESTARCRQSKACVAVARLT